MNATRKSTVRITGVLVVAERLLDLFRVPMIAILNSHLDLPKICGNFRASSSHHTRHERWNMPQRKPYRQIDTAVPGNHLQPERTMLNQMLVTFMSNDCDTCNHQRFILNINNLIFQVSTGQSQHLPGSALGGGLPTLELLGPSHSHQAFFS